MPTQHQDRVKTLTEYYFFVFANKIIFNMKVFNNKK